jgi:stage V sporulation protein S
LEKAFQIIAEEETLMKSTVVKVSAKSNVKGVAGSITKALEDGYVVEVTTIGAGALNQATKAIAMARGFVANKGRDAITRQGFGDTIIDGQERTVIKQFVSII